MSWVAVKNIKQWIKGNERCWFMGFEIKSATIPGSRSKDTNGFTAAEYYFYWETWEDLYFQAFQ